MNIEVKVADNKELERWDDIVDSSLMGTIFHKLDWLKITEKYTDSKLYPLIGYKGQDIVGLFPIFYMRRPFLKMLFSPPPQAGIPYMGMIIKFLSDKQEKRESLLNDFLEGIFHFIDDIFDANYIRFNLTPGFYDIRNFVWNGYSSKPSYDYILEITNKDTILEGFSQGLRKSIKHAEDSGLVFTKYAPNIGSIFNSLKQRYNFQGIKFTLNKEYLDALVKAFPNNIEYFVIEFDNRVTSELLCIIYKREIIVWLGGYSSKMKDSKGRTIYPNDFFHWKVIEYAIDNKIKKVQIIGGSTPQLCKFKSKYNPSLLLSFNLQKKGILSSIAERAYLFWKFKMTIPNSSKSSLDT